MKINSSKEVYVLGAGYSGLTTAVELAIRGYDVRIVAQSLGYMPPLTIVGTQSRRWPGSAMSNQLHDFEDLLGKLLYNNYSITFFDFLNFESRCWIYRSRNQNFEKTSCAYWRFKKNWSVSGPCSKSIKKR